MSSIKCPYCNHVNNGQIPFCAECGKVLPLGDEMEVMAETIGANFGIKWVLLGSLIILILTSVVVVGFKAVGMDLSFMKTKESARLNEAGIASLNPEYVISPSEEPVSIEVRTRGIEAYAGINARVVKICGKTVPVTGKTTAGKKAVEMKLYGIPITRYKINPTETISFIPPPCKNTGFNTVEVVFENGDSLLRKKGIYYTSVTSLWYLPYTDGGLSVLTKIANDSNLNAEELIDKYGEKLKVPTDDIIKKLHSIIKEDARMAMLSFPFWGLFLFEMLMFFIGGLISARLSPGITIKESMVAGILVVILVVIRNIMLLDAGGSYMVFQLLIMAPTYASMAAFGGLVGERWQGVLPTTIEQ